MANETFDSGSSDVTHNQSRSSYRLPVIALILLILAGGAWYLYHSWRAGDQVTVLKEQFSWTLTPAGASTTPRTTVALRVANVDVPVGIFAGTCSIIDGANWKLLEGELAGVICLRGETGVEIGVFSDGGTLILKRGEVEGTTQGAAKRTDFAPIVSS